jgi:hypothetical protein
VEGSYHAIGDTCTHRGGPLSEGDVQGTRVTCPWHGADFDLKTGAVLGPPAQKGVPSYKVMVGKLPFKRNHYESSSVIVHSSEWQRVDTITVLVQGKSTGPSAPGLD